MLEMGSTVDPLAMFSGGRMQSPKRDHQQPDFAFQPPNTHDCAAPPYPWIASLLSKNGDIKTGRGTARTVSSQSLATTSSITTSTPTPPINSINESNLGQYHNKPPPQNTTTTTRTHHNAAHLPVRASRPDDPHLRRQHNSNQQRSSGRHEQRICALGHGALQRPLHAFCHGGVGGARPAGGGGGEAEGGGVGVGKKKEFGWVERKD
ncbi:hypothetical protein HDK90DRAFT_190120 [Phyllosticta capitalensis]|uniref:Uncharacterized protein n=1 Tax=Phyllosticta capitalensis TaxID=121624 RepID=A0ABR1YWQ6_9PEZI